jgi:hypothetical protein
MGSTWMMNCPRSDNLATDATPEKSFVAKLFSPEEPDHSWGVEELGAYAKAQHEAIVHGEQSLTHLYWRLGNALELARRQFDRGQWGKYLESLGLNKTRVSKARAIFRRFGTPEAIGDLGVEEAYAERQRRQVHARSRPKSPGADERESEQSDVSPVKEETADDLEAFLNQISARADQLLDVAAFADQTRRRTLFPLYQAASERLRFLGRVLGVEDVVGP